MVDVTNPSDPQEIGYFDTPGSAQFFEVHGNFGYVADANTGIYVLDVTIPGNPDSVVILDTDDASAFNIQGDYLYLADGAAGFKVVDISNPISPIEKGSYDAGGYQFDVYAYNNFLFAAQGYRGLSIIDITSPNSPEETATLDMENARALHGYGDYVYVADNGDLRIIDVSDPSYPYEVYMLDWGWSASVFVHNNYAYVVGSPDLTIFDVSNPSSPVMLGELNGLPGLAFDVFVTGDYAYLSNGPNGLRIVNVSDPYSPWEEGYFLTLII